MSRLHRLASLRKVKPHDIIDLSRIVWCAARIEWVLRRRTLAEAAALAGMRLSSPETPCYGDAISLDCVPAATWRQAAIASRVAKGWPLGSTCLREALLVGSRLAAFGPQLVVGVTADETTGFAAHAWVRLGDIDLDRQARAFSALSFR